MTRLPPIPLATRLKRIRDVSGDLAREITRPVKYTDASRAMATIIKQDIDVVIRTLARPQR